MNDPEYQRKYFKKRYAEDPNSADTGKRSTTTIADADPPPIPNGGQRRCPAAPGPDATRGSCANTG